MRLFNFLLLVAMIFSTSAYAYPSKFKFTLESLDIGNDVPQKSDMVSFQQMICDTGKLNNGFSIMLLYNGSVFAEVRYRQVLSSTYHANDDNKGTILLDGRNGYVRNFKIYINAAATVLVERIE
ncbi:MAG: hypothetical protein NTY22_01605 [Proteobacteria bacterium]|nr:hypothetical protein [Pseudomonadota bacterium]